MRVLFIFIALSLIFSTLNFVSSSDIATLKEDLNDLKSELNATMEKAKKAEYNFQKNSTKLNNLKEDIGKNMVENETSNLSTEILSLKKINGQLSDQYKQIKHLKNSIITYLSFGFFGLICGFWICLLGYTIRRGL